MEQRRKPQVTVVHRPLKPQKDETVHPYLRAENEDDDGYDPYSDRREEPPLFEPSPWD